MDKKALILWLSDGRRFWLGRDSNLIGHLKGRRGRQHEQRKLVAGRVGEVGIGGG